MYSILVVDDEPLVTRTVCRILEQDGHQVEGTTDPLSVIPRLESADLDVVVADIRMAELDGLTLLRTIRDRFPRVKVILLTGEPLVETAMEAIREGAFDYLTKPVFPAILQVAVNRAGRVKVVEDENLRYRESLEKLAEERTYRIHSLLEGTASVLASAVEKRDPYTAGHQQRVSELANEIAGLMGISKDQETGLRIASLVHDVGKLGIPSSILTKPTRLSRSEFDLIKEHSRIGYEILKEIDFPWPVAQIVLQHHERMDGSGYPEGLGGDDILLESRILAVADVVEAMATSRPYRQALGIEMALDEITNNKGKRYDPPVVDACVELFRVRGYCLSEI